MSSYKLTYFNYTALAEPIRFLLSYGGIAFEDIRINSDVWAELKPNTPLEQLPILEVDGKTLYQFNPIVRFLAKKVDLNGNNDFETFDIDANLETISDLRQVLTRWHFTKNPAEKSAAEEETFKQVTFYLGKLESTVKNNGGYFVDGKLSVADIVFAGLNNFLLHMARKDIFADYPNLKSVVAKVLAEPSIKAWIAKRPKTDF